MKLLRPTRQISAAQVIGNLLQGMLPDDATWVLTAVTKDNEVCICSNSAAAAEFLRTIAELLEQPEAEPRIFNFRDPDGTI